jgi:hypothetical protein
LTTAGYDNAPPAAALFVLPSAVGACATEAVRVYFHDRRVLAMAPLTTAAEPAEIARPIPQGISSGGCYRTIAHCHSSIRHTTVPALPVPWTIRFAANHRD